MKNKTILGYHFTHTIGKKNEKVWEPSVLERKWINGNSYVTGEE